MPGILLCRSLLYSLGTVSLTEPRAVITSARVTGTCRAMHSFFTWVLGSKHAQQASYPPYHVPRPWSESL